MSTALHATHISNKGRGRSRKSQFFAGSRNTSSTLGRGFPNTHGRGSSILGPHPSSLASSGGCSYNRPTCQICHRLGHTALN